MDRFEQRGSLFVIIFVTLLFPGPALWAEPVDPWAARQATDTFLQARAGRPRVSPSTLAVAAEGEAARAQVKATGLRAIRDEDGTVLAYVTDLKPSGFVAVAADTDIAPVVAYSFRCPFPGDEDNPLNWMLRADMRLRRRGLAEHPELRTAATGRLWRLYLRGQGNDPNGPAFQQWPPEGTSATGGWLETAWVQEAPFNQFCPLDPVDRARSYVGCAGTALAQILNYYRQCKVRFTVDDSYMAYTGMRIDADSTLYDFPSFRELNGYLDAVQHKYEQGGDLNDVDAAALSLACGFAVQMDYSSGGSGTAPSDVRDALLGKLGCYSADMFGGLSRDTYRVLQENMINGLPALISICTPDGVSGHVLVCDGYNTNDEYHMNFGWGSDYPGQITEVWYHLPTDFLSHKYVPVDTLLNVQPARPILEVDPPTMNFYSAPGGDSAVQTLHMQNNVADVEVNSVSSPDGFLVATPSGEFSNRLDVFLLERLKVGANIRVKFHPEQAGGYYGTLAIHYGNGKTRYVILKGWSYTGGTQVPAGKVSGVWSEPNAPYFVTGNIMVPENGELVIEPGVKVFFVGPYSMTVGRKARLLARGNAAHPIELTAWNRDCGWGGLRFVESGADDVLSYCSLTFGKKGADPIPYAEDSQAAASGTQRYGVDSRGGAIFCLSSDPTIESCWLTNNIGDMGGAIYCINSWAVISNTLIANNASLGGRPRAGGICCDQAGVPELRNCTIVHNSPGGILATSWDGTNVTNTIVWGNDVYQILAEECGPTVTFCDVQGGYSGAGNLDADPCFFDPTAGVGTEYEGLSGNWALQSRSPCLNAGTPVEGLPATDAAGGTRVYSDILDVGAYENQSDLPLITVSPAGKADAGCVPVDANATVTFEITNTGKQDCKITSVDISGAADVFSVTTPISDRVLAPGESIPVEVTFRPTVDRGYTGNLSIYSTASNAPHMAIMLEGLGVSGTIVPAGSVNGTWRKAGSPYIITGDIRISKGRTLTIEPGVNVEFAGHFRFTVGYRATLRAIGTEEDRIVFTARDQEEGWFGIRFLNSGADDVLQYCTLEYAQKPRNGGGGVLDLLGGAVLCCCPPDEEPGFPIPSSPTVDSCLLTNNSARTGGAIMCTDESEATLTHNTIVENSAELDGAGIASYYAYPTIANNVIARNAGAVVGGGIVNVYGYPMIINNTIVRNRPSAMQLEQTALFGLVFESCIVVNNIVWDDEISMSDDILPGEYVIQYNDIQGGWEDEGNVDVDPLFADPENGDYHLKSQAGRWDPVAGDWTVDDVTSPCIDAGDPAADIMDEPEPNGGCINMGAHGGTDQASKSPGQ